MFSKSHNRLIYPSFGGTVNHLMILTGLPGSHDFLKREDSKRHYLRFSCDHGKCLVTSEVSTEIILALSCSVDIWGILGQATETNSFLLKWNRKLLHGLWVAVRINHQAGWALGRE